METSRWQDGRTVAATGCERHGFPAPDGAAERMGENISWHACRNSKHMGCQVPGTVLRLPPGHSPATFPVAGCLISSLLFGTVLNPLPGVGYVFTETVGGMTAHADQRHKCEKS